VWQTAAEGGHKRTPLEGTSGIETAETILLVLAISLALHFLAPHVGVFLVDVWFSAASEAIIGTSAAGRLLIFLLALFCDGSRLFLLDDLILVR